MVCVCVCVCVVCTEGDHQVDDEAGARSWPSCDQHTMQPLSAGEVVVSYDSTGE